VWCYSYAFNVLEGCFHTAIHVLLHVYLSKYDFGSVIEGCLRFAFRMLSSKLVL
jgi:hypothetical protein